MTCGNVSSSQAAQDMFVYAYELPTSDFCKGGCVVRWALESGEGRPSLLFLLRNFNLSSVRVADLLQGFARLGLNL